MTCVEKEEEEDGMHRKPYQYSREERAEDVRVKLSATDKAMQPNHALELQRPSITKSTPSGAWLKGPIDREHFLGLNITWRPTGGLWLLGYSIRKAQP